jgi:hypothetical protein
MILELGLCYVVDDDTNTNCQACKFKKIWVLFCFTVTLFFFSRHYSQPIARPICIKFGTNVSSCAGFRMLFNNLEKMLKKKPFHDEQKNIKKSVFSHCDETVFQRNWWRLLSYVPSVCFRNVTTHWHLLFQTVTTNHTVTYGSKLIFKFVAQPFIKKQACFAYTNIVHTRACAHLLH